MKLLSLTLLSIIGVTFFAAPTLAAPVTEDSIFSTEEILDESTLETKTLQDWHIDTETGSTRQKLVEINVAQYIETSFSRWPPWWAQGLSSPTPGHVLAGKTKGPYERVQRMITNVFDRFTE